MILKIKYKSWTIIPILILSLFINSSVIFADNNQQTYSRKNFDITEVYMGAPDKQKILLMGSISYLGSPRKSDYMEAKKSGDLYYTTTVGHMRQVLRKAGVSLHTQQDSRQNGARVLQIGMLQDLEIIKGNTQLPIYVVKFIMNGH